MPENLCPLPANESQRLRAVLSYDILDTPPEVDFDTLTRMAANAFNTPAAVIGLMDSERIWFKSQLGLGVPQLHRQIAFCAHTVMLPNEPLVIEDLAEDTRFRESPLVRQAPFLRFYAGAPLVDRHGFVLGTLAVVDTQPRTFRETQRALLRDLSTLVIAILESRNRARLLGQMAVTDHLTGLSNRIMFEQTLNSEISLAQRTNQPFSVFCMDLDNFKDVNDNHGHAAGDEVLREVALRMSREVRNEDLLVRLGGDEFGVFIRPGAEDSAESLSFRIIEAVSTPIKLSNGMNVNVGISIGVASYANETDSVASILARADQALYTAKQKR